MRSKIVSLALVGLILLPLFVLAQVTNPPQPGTVTNVEDIINLITKIRDWIFGIALALVVIFGIWAGLLFVTAGGDAAKINEARQRLIYAIVGAAVAILAWSIVPMVRTFLGV